MAAKLVCGCWRFVAGSSGLAQKTDAEKAAPVTTSWRRGFRRNVSTPMP
ncbi:MAG: hypothetical protein CM1200mP2_24470 [Planctomycetaceae bacterium]|nr:MAG: hypothetical protein CM1200mP2_24470 [Planctomycetaceae bacterium]